MKVIKLKIGKKTLECTYGLGFLGDVLDATGFSVQELATKWDQNPFKIVPLMLYYSTAHVTRRKGNAVEFTEFDIVDLLDDNGGLGHPEVKRFLLELNNSMTEGVPKEDDLPEETDEPKKK